MYALSVEYKCSALNIQDSRKLRVCRRRTNKKNPEWIRGSFFVGEMKE